MRTLSFAADDDDLVVTRLGLRFANAGILRCLCILGVLHKGRIGAQHPLRRGTEEG